VNYFTGEYTRTPAGFSKRWFFWKIPMWHYRLDPVRPLTFHMGSQELTPDRNLLLSDSLSSPPFLWGIKGLSQTDFPKAVYFHDTAARYGGLYFNGEFRKITAWYANNFMFLMVCAEGGTFTEASRIYVGLAPAVPFFWNEERQAKNRKADGVECA
jgi:hypothetical protein